ncbi:hypothetical protein NSA19_09230 [Actinomyces bowdenii]|uniref:hypothetical protein n=1 Tax=Actinomyces bowdenii TaxID=131109 RepID=UPI00214CF88D|nr:hypothetical protein [Actinomyces bowdenii]MCR2053018.1 hypothetical protein [Actinomyces bowdenii]
MPPQGRPAATAAPGLSVPPSAPAAPSPSAPPTPAAPRRAVPYRAAPLSPTPRAIVSDEVVPLALYPEPHTPAPRPLRLLGSPIQHSGEPVPERSGHDGPSEPSEPDDEARRRSRRARQVAAIVLLLLIGIRRDLVGSMALGDIAALAAIPVTWSAVRHQRRFSPLLLLGTLAGLTGLLLSWTVGPTFHINGGHQRAMVMSLLALPWATAAFVWGARHLGASRAAAALSAGTMLSALPLLVTNDNPWKFGIGVPMTLMVLALINHRGRPLQLLALAALAAVFMAHDARLLPAFLAIIAATVFWQATASWFRWRLPAPRRAAIIQALVLTVIGIGAITAVLAASASGSLGVDAQTRTLAQSRGESNFLLNARPEVGAAWALAHHRPWGYGAGVLPRYEDIQVAKDGMAALGYDPSNGYVENFMFGNGFELHSALVNVWVAASLPGAALMLLIAGLTLLALLRDLGGLRITPWLFLAGMVVLQNILVGPWAVLPPYLPFVLGSWILLPSLRELNHRRQAERAT